MPQLVKPATVAVRTHRLPAPAGARPSGVLEADAPTAPTLAGLPDEALVVLRRIAQSGEGCARAMAEHLHERLPELDHRTVSGSALAETRECCQAHLDVVARVAVVGGAAAAVDVPAAAVEHARSLIRRGVGLDVLLRTYHLGQAFLNALAASRFAAEGFADGPRLRATVAVDAFLFDYIDRVSEVIATVYGNERDTWVRSPEAVRADALRAIVERRGGDERLLVQRLGYELAGRHVAMVLAARPQEGTFDDLRRDAKRLASALGAPAPLVVRGEGGVAWAWCHADDLSAQDVVRLREEARPRDGVRIAMAGPAAGINGFRETHLDARETAAFVERYPAASGEREMTSYRSIELASLLLQEPERATRFMRSCLGALGGDDLRLRELRSTVRSFLQHNRSHARAGAAMFLHKNTVFNRIRHAEKLLGVRAESWGVELEAALMLFSIVEASDAAGGGPSTTA